MERIRLVALYIQHAEHTLSHFERQSNFRTRLR
jgi:hypothetical protein